MAKLKVKSEKAAKVEATATAPESENAAEKIKKKAKKAKSGNLEKNVKNVLKNGDTKSKKKDSEVLKALTGKDQVAKKKEKNKKKRNLKEKDEATKAAEEPGTETELPDELVSREVILKAIAAAKEGMQKDREAKETKELFDEELKYGIEVCFTKIPNMPTHARRVCLKHSLLPEKPDICLIVRDEKEEVNQSTKDHEKVIDKYEKILSKHKITCIKTIIPLTKLKQDYGPHAMKIKLLNSYDLFLVEPEVAEHAYSVLGRHFIQKRKRPIQVDFSKTKVLKEWVDKTLLKVCFKVSSNSQLTSIAVGAHKMDDEMIADNVETVLEQLKEDFPGGWMNIKRVYFYPLRPSKIHIPIYYSKIDPNIVEVPTDKGYVVSRLDQLAEQFNKKSKKVKVEKGKVVKVKTPGKAGENNEKNKKNKKKRKAKNAEDGEEGDEPKAKKTKPDTAEATGEAAGAGEKKKKKKNKKKGNKPAENGDTDKPKDEGKENPEKPKAEVKEKSEKSKEKPNKKKNKAESGEKPAVPAENGSPAKKQKQKKKKKPLAAAENGAGDD